MLVTCKKKTTAKLKLIDNLSVALLNDLTTASGSFWLEVANDCLRTVIVGIISVECHHRNFNLYIHL